MKKLFIFFFLLLNYNLFADYTTPNTSVSWNLNDLVTNSGGTVTFSGGSYFINSNLTIAQSDTLKILSNAVVKIALNSVVLVNGTFIVNPPDSVKITSIDTTQKFTELRLDGAGISCSFSKLIYEYSFNGFRLLNVSPNFTNCTFRYNCNGNSSQTVPALNLFNSNPVILNCLFYRNHRAAIAGGSNIANAPQILYSQFIENNLLNGNVPQINLGQSGSGTTVIRGCTILGSAILSGGIAALPIGTLNLVVENNIIKKNRYGIALNGSVNANIRGNIIDSNNIQGLPIQGGSGLNFVGSGINARVSKNIIRGNLWGVTLQNSAAPVFGDLTVNDTNYNGLNQIYHNHNNGVFYDFYNNTANPIKAENNYWGTLNLDSIEAHIFHQPDSSAFGLVDFLPIWNLAGIHEISGETPAQFMLYDAYPNPFNPETNIKFTLIKNGYTTLKIYDIAGREVASLINDDMGKGSYIYKYNAGLLASGIYFYTLIQGNSYESKKLILIK